MKKIFLLVFLSCGFISFAQVGIGTPSPDPSSMLEVSSNKKGILIPNVPLTSVTDNTTIASSKNSLLVFNTTNNANIKPGYFYWSTTESKWKGLITETEIAAATTVSNASAVNTSTVTVNGVTSTGAPIINDNSLTLVSGKLKSTVNGVATTDLDVLGDSKNGLTDLNGEVKLGGALTEATTLTTDATNTLALSGLQASTTATDDKIVVTSGAGNVLKTVPYFSVQGAISSKSANYDIVLKDESILVNTSSGDVTIKLPDAALASAKKFSVKKTSNDDNRVIVSSVSGTIDSVPSVSGSIWLQGWVFQSDGTNWFIVSRF